MRKNELIVDNFAGGGGASLGIEMALGRSPDIAINHDAEAIAMHKANHPKTRHYCEDVWEVNPAEACGGKPVGLAWFSPDCKHFSKAKGGKPVSKKIRGLAWIVVKWAKAVRPRVAILENVEEFQDWGPLDDQNKPCPDRKGDTFKRWAAQLRNLGYQIEWRELRACDYDTPTIRKRLFLVARCDGGRIVWPEPTNASPKEISSRDLFASQLAPWRTAAECIDWSIPCPSIFDRKKPLAPNTLRRIAAGLKRYVIDSPSPFIVNLTHHGSDRVESLDEPLRTVTGAHRGEKALVSPYIVGVGGRAGQSPERTADAPLGTVTSKRDVAVVTPYLTELAHSDMGRWGKGTPDLHAPLGTVHAGGKSHALVAPLLVRGGQTGGNGNYSNSVTDPLTTIVSKAEHMVVSPTLIQAGGEKSELVAAFLAKHYGGVVGSRLTDPTGTVTATDHHSLVAATLLHNTTGNPATSPDGPLKTVATGGHHGLVASHLVKLYGSCRDGQPLTDPIASVTAQGLHLAEVRAFLVAYFGSEKDGAKLTDPLRTATSRDRFGLVTIHGDEYVIADIGLRMLSPRELFRAQGFPAEYEITPEVDGKPLTKTAQVRMCGNSVCPPLAKAVAQCQFPEATA